MFVSARMIDKVCVANDDAIGHDVVQGRFIDATQALLPVRGKLGLLGGSEVDQDVVEQLVIEW